MTGSPGPSSWTVPGVRGPDYSANAALSAAPANTGVAVMSAALSISRLSRAAQTGRGTVNERAWFTSTTLL
jgi:hypothetical protein